MTIQCSPAIEKNVKDTLKEMGLNIEVEPRSEIKRRVIYFINENDFTDTKTFKEYASKIIKEIRNRLKAERKNRDETI